MGSIPALRERGRSVALATAAALLVCGCASPDSGEGRPDLDIDVQSTFGQAAGPVDSITWGLPYGEPPTLDPPNTAYYSSTFTVSQLCDSLLRTGADGTPTPALATSVEQVNPTTVVITLRQGVQFWDGTELTADDVVYSLDHTRDPSTAIGSTLDAIESVTATDPYTVTIGLSRPDALVANGMATLAGVVWQKKAAEQAGDAFGTPDGGLMCTGPYELSSWTSGSSIELDANPDYWDEAFQPSVQHISLRFFADSTTLVNALRSGDVDGAYEVSAQAIPSLADADSGQLLFGPGDIFSSMSITNVDGPLGDVGVRRALSMALDRQGIADVVFNGAARPYYTQINPGNWNRAALEVYQQAYEPYAAEGERYGQEDALAEARELVANSTVPDRPLRLIVPGGDQTIGNIAALVQQQAQEIGLTVEIEPLPGLLYSQATYDATARDGADLLLGISYNGSQEPASALAYTYVPGSAYNYTGFDNPDVTALFQAARAEADPVARAELMLQVQDAVEQDPGMIPLVEVYEISFLNKRLSGMTTSFDYLSTPSLARLGAAG